MNITNIANVIAPAAMHKIVGMRPGEKLHEQMIGIEDAPYTFEYEKHFKILPSINDWSEDPARIKDGRKVADTFSYESNKNEVWMSDAELAKWIAVYNKDIGTN